jgi:DNA polymerase III alpha subunit
MKYDKLGQAYTNSYELCDMLYQQPDLALERFLVEDWHQYNNSVRITYANLPLVNEYHPYPADYNIETFHQTCQSQWHMPEQYRDMDIAQWTLDQCHTQEELQRVGQELLLFQERNLFPLLKQLKFIVDTWRSNNVVWGVGRGSSVASYVLFLLGVHRINSMYYDLDIAEFLR